MWVHSRVKIRVVKRKLCVVCIEHTAVCKKTEPDDVMFGVGKNHVWFCTAVHKDNGGASLCNSVSFVFTAACKRRFLHQ